MTGTIEQPDETVAVAAERCPNCGADAAQGQLMCLECGQRLALDYRRPTSWKLAGAIIGVVLLLAGGALALALAEVTNDADSQSRAPAATQAVTTGQPEVAPAATGTAPVESSPAPSVTETTPPEPLPGDAAPADAGGPATWPAGESAYTVILASAGSRQEAEAKRQEAQDAGISAGILESGDFPSLRPGYWVVFDGQFDTVEQATGRAEEDRGKGFSDAYPRLVESR